MNRKRQAPDHLRTLCPSTTFVVPPVAMRAPKKKKSRTQYYRLAPTVAASHVSISGGSISCSAL